MVRVVVVVSLLEKYYVNARFSGSRQYLSNFVFGAVDVVRHYFARGAFSGESQCGVECFRVGGRVARVCVWDVAFSCICFKVVVVIVVFIVFLQMVNSQPSGHYVEEDVQGVEFP